MRHHGLCSSLLCCRLAEAEAARSARLLGMQGSLHAGPRSCPNTPSCMRLLTRRSCNLSHYMPSFYRARCQRTASAVAPNLCA